MGHHAHHTIPNNTPNIPGGRAGSVGAEIQKSKLLLARASDPSGKLAPALVGPKSEFSPRTTNGLGQVRDTMGMHSSRWPRLHSPTTSVVVVAVNAVACLCVRVGL